MDGLNIRKDNSGITLLEVIVAVSIFSITVMVLLQGFVTSGRLNRKSDTYLEATSTGQNVMEEIKAKRFKEIALAFNYPVDRTTGKSRFSFLDSQSSDIGNSLQISEVVKQSDGSYSVVRKYNEADGDDDSRVTASVISHDDGVSYKLNPNKTGKYYYTMSNVKTLHNSFDVLVEFDGGEDSGYKKSSMSAADEKNDYLAPNISKLDSKNNAFLIMAKDWDKNAMVKMIDLQKKAADEAWQKDFETACPSRSEEKEDGTVIHHPTQDETDAYISTHPKPVNLDYEDLYAHTKRILKIKLEKSGGSIIVKAKYILTAYDYTDKTKAASQYATMSICPCHNASVNLPDDAQPISGCFCTYSSAYTAFYSSENEDDLQSIYIFYYPNYNSVNAAQPLDEIYFDNEIPVTVGTKQTNYPVNLYVTKQRDEETGEPNSSQEVKYRMSLTVTEAPPSTWSANKGLFKAATSLRTNLDYDISNITEIAKRMSVKQMKLRYQDAGHSKLNAKDYVAKNILNCNGLDDRSAKDRIYNVTVKVYKHGEAEKNFTGDPILTLDGAKEN